MKILVRSKGGFGYSERDFVLKDFYTSNRFYCVEMYCGDAARGFCIGQKSFNDWVEIYRGKFETVEQAVYDQAGRDGWRVLTEMETNLL